MAWKDLSPKWYKVSKFVVCDLLKTIKSGAWIKFWNNAWEFAGKLNNICHHSRYSHTGKFVKQASNSVTGKFIVEGKIELPISEWKEDFFSLEVSGTSIFSLGTETVLLMIRKIILFHKRYPWQEITRKRLSKQLSLKSVVIEWFCTDYCSYFLKHCIKISHSHVSTK